MSAQAKDYSEYVKHTAELMGLKLTSESFLRVVEHFNSLAEISILVTEFNLTEAIEIAPVFQPKNSQ